MKKILLLAFLLGFILKVYSQEQVKGIKFHSLTISPLNVYFADRDGGLGINMDVSFNSGIHIFKIYAGIASEFKLNVFGNEIYDSFEEFNLMYGRELNIEKWFSIDFFVGVGSFSFKYDRGTTLEYKKSVVGFPLQSKIRFNPGQKFSLGLQLHSNINKATTIYQPGIFLQYRM